MQHKGKQQHLLATKSGSLLNPEKSDHDGLLDNIRLRKTPKQVFYFDFLACIDQSGNPFIFYHNKNRYVNISVPSPAIQLAYIDEKGGQIAIALKNYQIQINSCMNGRTLKTLKGHEHSILNLHVNHNRQLLLSVSQEVCILSQLNTYDKVHSIFAKNSIFVNACFMPSATEIATIFADKTVSIWNLNSFEVIFRVTLQENVKHCQMLPSIDGHNLIINTFNKVYIIDENHVLTQQFITQGYGSGVQQLKSLRKGGIFLLTRNNMLIQIDKGGNIVKQIDLVGKIPINFDIYDNKIAIVTNVGEVLIYDLNKIGNNQFDSTVGNNNSVFIKENYPDTINLNNNTTTNINIKKVGDDTSNNSKVFNASQSSVAKKNSRSFSQSHYNQYTLAKSYKNSGDPLREILNYSKLESFIKQFTIFPDDKRSLAWRALFNLPMNQEAFTNLLKMGIHPAYNKLNEQYPIKSESLFSRLQRILSCLAYYCPLFAEVDYLPQLVFPFVKLFKRGEELFIFEVCLSILLHFFQRYFENFPNAPIQILLFHDQTLQILDSELHNHLVNILQYQSIKHFWPYVRQLYTNLFTQEQWLQLMDFLVLHNDYPQMLIIVMICYFQYFRNVLLRMNEPEQFEIFFNRSNSVDMQKLLNQAFKISKEIDMDQFQISFQYLLPLEKQQYQILNLYPKNSVSYQAKIREQIEEDQQKILQKQQQILRLKQMTDKLTEMDQIFSQKQQLMVQAERDRQEMFDYQVEMRAQQQFQQEQQLRQQRINKLQELEQHMNKAMQQQLDLQQQEQEYLNQQFQKTQVADNLRLQSIQEEETLQQLEYQMFQKFTKNIEIRNQQEKQRRIQSEIEFRAKQKEYQDQIKSEQWKTDSQQQNLRLEQIKQQKMQQLQDMSNQAQEEEAQYHQMIQQFQQDLKMIQLEREKKLRDYHLEQQNEQEQNNLKMLQNGDDKNKSMIRRQQMENQLQQLARQHEEKLRVQEQQFLDQVKRSYKQDISNFYFSQLNLKQNKNNQISLQFDQSSDQRIPMTSQKQGSDFYDYPTSEKQQLQLQSSQKSLVVEDEREKFYQFKQQLRDEINTMKDKEHDKQFQQVLKQREDEIFKRTQQIREQINSELQNKDISHKFSPGSSSQFSLYQPQQQIELDSKQLEDSQLTYSSGFPSQRQY